MLRGQRDGSPWLIVPGRVPGESGTVPDRRENPPPARPARWIVRCGTCRGERGAVLYHCDARRVVHDPSGTPLLRVVPDVARTVTRAGFVAQVAAGALGGSREAVAGLPLGEHANALARGTWSAPRLLQEVRGRMTVAALADTPRGVAVTLLPRGHINDGLVARRLTDRAVAAARALGPLAHQLADDGTARLVGVGGRLYAHERVSGVHRTVEIPAGPVPALWLFGILEAARWRGD